MRFLQKFLLITSLLVFFASCTKPKVEADIWIRGGLVFDGLSMEGQKMDVAIKEDKIVFVGCADTLRIEAEKTIEAQGKIVSPGFIDPHTHADRDLNKTETAHNHPFLMQGVTTVVVGNDGSSFYPISEYKELYRKQGIGTNVAMLFGHGTIREQVIGKSDRAPSEAELNKMKALAEEEMRQGAFGISTGLYYAPGSYSETEEVIELSRVVVENGGIYDTHLRDESSFNIGLVKAIEEAIEIGEVSGIPIHISHIKCLGLDVWGKSAEVIELIEKARGRGVEVTANQYPYDASSTSLKAAVVPRWAESGGLDSLFYRLEAPATRERVLSETVTNMKRRGGPSKLLIVKLPDTTYVGKNLEEISAMLSIPAEEAVFEMLKIGHAKVVSFNMIEEDVNRFMGLDWVVTGSDGNTGHPRKYGSFPRKYAHYVKRKELISLADFINGSTSRTAKIFRMEKRGVIQEGYYADVIVFDPEGFREEATYTDAFRYATGLDFSIINGKIAVNQGRPVDAYYGRVLQKEK
jgi:N-acyl-D-aspartate/D-glutamate deacylase